MTRRQMLGRAGELRIASELILRGYNPMFPEVDNGVDMVLEDNGARIQVKTFSPRSSSKTTVRFTSLENVDFGIVWEAGTTCFWVLPVGAVYSIKRKQKAARVVNKPSSKHQRFKNRWDLLGEPSGDCGDRLIDANTEKSTLGNLQCESSNKVKGVQEQREEEEPIALWNNREGWCPIH